MMSAGIYQSTAVDAYLAHANETWIATSLATSAVVVCGTGSRIRARCDRERR
jgi:hypothetical protein